jgi:hypothetical protein
VTSCLAALGRPQEEEEEEEEGEEEEAEEEEEEEEGEGEDEEGRLLLNLRLNLCERESEGVESATIRDPIAPVDTKGGAGGGGSRSGGEREALESVLVSVMTSACVPPVPVSWLEYIYIYIHI